LNLPSLKPLNKVSLGGLAGLLTALIFWALRKYVGIEIDIEGTALITSLVAVAVQMAASYLTPLSTDEVEQIVQVSDEEPQL
jgi:hypothetical protein